MAQYEYDMSAGNPFTRANYSQGDTVSLVASPSLIGGQSLKIELVDGLYLANLDLIPDNYRVDGLSNTDLEYLILVRLSGGSSRSAFLILAFDDYSVNLRNETSETIVNLNVNGTAASGITGVDPEDQWVWMRFRKRGDKWHGQQWAYGTPEPASEAITADLFSASSKYLNDGWTVVIASRSFTPIDMTAFIDFISVGTYGDPAPRGKLQEYYVKDGGVWKPVDTLYARDGGVWKEAEYHARDGGVWKKVYG